MRAVDLAVFADTLAAEAAVLAARLERARARLRQADIEDAARGALPRETVRRLEAIGVLGPVPPRDGAEEVALAQVDLAALAALQGWVEAELARAGAYATRSASSLEAPASSEAR